MKKNKKQKNNFSLFSSKYFPFALFILAFAVRLFYAFFVRQEYGIWQGDEGVYFRNTLLWLQGHGYHSAARMPLLPALTYLFIKLTNHTDIPTMHIFSCFLGSFIPLATYYLAKAFTNNDQKVSAWSGIFTVFYPYFVHEASLLDTENVFIPLAIWFILILYRILKGKQKPWNFVLLGLVFTGACYTRPTLLIFPALLFIYLLHKKWNLLKISSTFGITLLVFMICIAPWSISKTKQEGSFVLLATPYDSMIGSTNKITMFDRNLSGVWLNLERDYPEVIPEFTGVPGSKTYEAGSIEYVYVGRVLQKYWYRVPFLTMNKIKWLFSYSPKDPHNRNFKDDLTGFLSYGLLLPFFLLSFFYNKKISLAKELTLLLMILLVIMTLITSGNTRFRLPLDPLMIIVTFYFLKNEVFLRKRSVIF